MLVTKRIGIKNYPRTKTKKNDGSSLEKKRKKKKKHALQISLESNSSKRLFSAKIEIIIIL